MHLINFFIYFFHFIFTENDEQPRRFKSSLLGGELPYTGGHQKFFLTKAQSKEYPPPSLSVPETTGECSSSSTTIIRQPESIIPESQIINLSTTQKQPEKILAEPAAVRCSVIQRVSSVHINNDQEQHSPLKSPRIIDHDSNVNNFKEQNPFNEQIQPINYHVPKKIDVGIKRRKENEVLVGCEEEEDRKVKKLDTAEERESRVRDAKRAILHRVLLHHIRSLPPGSPLISRLVGIVQAAAGHGRSTNNSGGQSNASTNGNSGNSSGSIHFSGSSLGCGGNSSGGGSVGGAGAGGNGRDNRSNYGPNSPPTGSLPPFYESLKGGNGLNSFNAQNNSNENSFNNFIVHSENGHLECNSNGEMTHLSEFPGSPHEANSKQYSVLQNVYLQNGMILKDEIDLDYESKIDTLSLNGNLLQNYVDGYTDSMMADLTNSVDPLQLTATLTFSSSNEHALLESLTDAVDLSQFLQRLPSDEDLELSSTQSVNDSDMNKSSLDSFQDHLINGRINGFQNDQRQMFYKTNQQQQQSNNYENPPPYQSRDVMNNNSNITSNHQHNMLHHSLSNYDLESSLPSPSSSYELATSPNHQQMSSQHMSSKELQLSSVSTSSPSNISSSSSIQSSGKSMKGRRSSSSSKSSSPDSNTQVGEAKIHVLQQRVSYFIISR